MQNLRVSSVCVYNRRLGRVELARHTVAGLAPPDAASAFSWSVGVPKPGERTAQQVVRQVRAAHGGTWVPQNTRRPRTDQSSGVRVWAMSQVIQVECSVGQHAGVGHRLGYYRSVLTIVNLGLGNVASVCNMLDRLGYKAQVGPGAP